MIHPFKKRLQQAPINERSVVKSLLSGVSDYEKVRHGGNLINYYCMKTYF